MNYMGVPTIFEKSEGDRLMWDIYSRQLKDRIVWLGTEVNSAVANVIVAQLLYLDTLDKNKDIMLYINSPGGSHNCWHGNLRHYELRGF